MDCPLQKPPPMTARHAESGCGGPAALARRLQALESGTQVAGHIAHDINNLLGVINAGAEVLLPRVAVDSVAKECVNDILGASTRAVALTAQLLAFSVRENPAPGPVDVNVVITNAEGVIRRLLGTGVRLTLDLAPDPMFVRTCAAHLERILMNLSANARDAMSKGGHLCISTRASVDEDASGIVRAGDLARPAVLLTVADTGVGMDKPTLRRIFAPFFTTKGSRGTGLGLSTVDQLVHACGGWIEVESEPGVGTQFRIFLPLVDVVDRPKGNV